jgi:hypothetical protein
MDMATDELHSRLIDAELEFGRAQMQLTALRRAALYGRFDASEFAKAVAASQRAAVRLADAREAYRTKRTRATEPAKDAERNCAPSDTPPPRQVPPPAEVPPPPVALSPRMLFARWLVQTGRLSDS